MLTPRRFKSFSLTVPVILGLIFGTCCTPSCAGYSVLTHEAIIDAAWKESIVPLLVKRFPKATPEELLQAWPLGVSPKRPSDSAGVIIESTVGDYPVCRGRRCAGVYQGIAEDEWVSASCARAAPVVESGSAVASSRVRSGSARRDAASKMRSSGPTSGW